MALRMSSLFGLFSMGGKVPALRDAMKHTIVSSRYNLDLTEQIWPVPAFSVNGLSNQDCDWPLWVSLHSFEMNYLLPNVFLNGSFGSTPAAIYIQSPIG